MFASEGIFKKQKAYNIKPDNTMTKEERIKRLEEIAIEKGCRPLPLGFFSLVNQSDEATEFWNKLSDFCEHVPRDDRDIEDAIRYEFKYRHNLLN